MISVEYKSFGLITRLFIVKVSYVDSVTNQETVGLNKLLQTKFDAMQVATLLRAFTKDAYKLTIQQVETKHLKFPGGYYESFGIDDLASQISRLRFVRTSVTEVPKVVYIKQEKREEL